MQNDVLVRLREPVVTTVSETTYSALIGKFVNDAKRQIEDSYTWNCLSQTVTVTTTSGTSSYSLTGVGQKFRVVDAINTTSLISLTDIPFVDMNLKLNFGAPAQSIPSEYCFNGEDGGTSSSEAYALFRGMLSDAIATESTRYPEESNFEAV